MDLHLHIRLADTQTNKRERERKRERKRDRERENSVVSNGESVFHKLRASPLLSFLFVFFTGAETFFLHSQWTFAQLAHVGLRIEQKVEQRWSNVRNLDPHFFRGWVTGD